MKSLSSEQKAGLMLTVIAHLAVLIALLAAGLGVSLQTENSFILDFSGFEEQEKLLAEIEKLEKEAQLQQAISDKLQKELGGGPTVRNVAVDRAALKDDRGTDAEQLYKDAARLQEELNKGFNAPNEDFADISKIEPEKKKEETSSTYSGPSVVSYMLEGRKASHLPIPSYRCMGGGEVTVLITVNPAGMVVGAKVDDGSSSPDGCLRSFAIRAARLSKFSSSPSAPPSQNGNIVYKFVAQ